MKIGPVRFGDSLRIVDMEVAGVSLPYPHDNFMGDEPNST